MTDLSPQAQAVQKAALSAYWSAEQEAPSDAEVIAAAALEAAADQVVPDDAVITRINVSSSIERIIENCIRTQLLAIAAELRGQGDSND